MSRSVVFTMLALHQQMGLPLTEALQQIKRQHPITQPHPELLRSLCRYCQRESELPNLLHLGLS